MPTLKDKFVVKLFASHTYKVLYKRWGSLNPNQRANSAFQSVTTALKPVIANNGGTWHAMRP